MYGVTHPSRAPHLTADESTASHADSWMLKSSTAGSRPSSMADEKPGGRTVNVGMLPAVEGRPLHGGSRPSTGGGIRPGPAGREEGPGGSGRVSVAGAAGSGVSFSVGPALLRSGSFQSSRIIFAPTAPMLDDVSGLGSGPTRLCGLSPSSVWFWPDSSVWFRPPPPKVCPSHACEGNRDKSERKGRERKGCRKRTPVRETGTRETNRKGADSMSGQDARAGNRDERNEQEGSERMSEDALFRGSGQG